MMATKTLKSRGSRISSNVSGYRQNPDGVSKEEQRCIPTSSHPIARGCILPLLVEFCCSPCLYPTHDASVQRHKRYHSHSNRYHSHSDHRGDGNHKVTGEHRIFGYVFIDAANCELQLLVGRKGFPNRGCATECFTGKMF